MTIDITATALDNMTDKEAKEYFEGLETDRWVEEYKNIF